MGNEETHKTVTIRRWTEEGNGRKFYLCEICDAAWDKYNLVGRDESGPLEALKDLRLRVFQEYGMTIEVITDNQ